MRCPYCGCEDTQVKDSRPTEENPAIRRRRNCPGLRRPLHDLRARAAARDHRRQALGPARAVRPREASRSVEIALRKRPIEPERIERMVSGIVRQLESMGETGDAVLDDRRTRHGGAEAGSIPSPMCASPRSIATSARRPTSRRCWARSRGKRTNRPYLRQRKSYDEPVRPGDRDEATGQGNGITCMPDTWTL